MGGYQQQLWDNISFTQVFGNIHPKLVCPPSRRLKLIDPIIFKRYQVALKEIIKHHKVPKFIYFL